MNTTLKKNYVCQKCGFSFPKWSGRCQNCASWNSLVEEICSPSLSKHSSQSPSSPIHLGDFKIKTQPRISSGFKELDRLLGGGILNGSFVLIGGEPGIGKSTLLLQVSNHLIVQDKKVLYVSGEESVYQIKNRAERLNVSIDRSLFVLSETDVNAVISSIEKIKPDFVVIDSIQIMYHRDYSSSPGTVNQVRECANFLMLTAKRLNVSIFVVGHVNKEGLLAGPKVLEHIVDTVLYFEGDSNQEHRIVRSVKNRFGSTNESAVFDMKAEGLVEVLNPSNLFLSDKRVLSSGSVIVASMEGSKPMFFEIQALVSQSYQQSYLKRVSTFMDHNRLALLIAIIEKCLKISFSSKDVFVHLLGGIKRSDASFDLGVILAIVSSLKNISLLPALTVVGEVGLGGEVRQVNQCDRRILESEKLGFSRCMIPCLGKKKISLKSSIQMIEVQDINSAIQKGLEL